MHHGKNIFRILRQPLGVLKEVNLKMKLSKCQFFKYHLHYLGHLISKQGIQPLPENASAIRKFKEPSNIDDLHHFLGLTGYYRKIVQLFTNETKPQNKLLKKDTQFQRLLQCQAAFKHLKQALCKKPILQFPSLEKPYTLLLMQSIMHIQESSSRQLKFLRI